MAALQCNTALLRAGLNPGSGIMLASGNVISLTAAPDSVG
jgi:hypothetical protein